MATEVISSAKKSFQKRTVLLKSFFQNFTLLQVKIPRLKSALSLTFRVNKYTF